MRTEANYDLLRNGVVDRLVVDFGPVQSDESRFYLLI